MAYYPEFRDFDQWAAKQAPNDPNMARTISMCREHIRCFQRIRRPSYPLEIRMALKDFRKLEAMKSAVLAVRAGLTRCCGQSQVS